MAGVMDVSHLRGMRICLQDPWPEQIVGNSSGPRTHVSLSLPNPAREDEEDAKRTRFENKGRVEGATGARLDVACWCGGVPEGPSERDDE